MRYMVHHNHEGEMEEVVHYNVDEMMLVHRVGMLMMVHGVGHNNDVEMKDMVQNNYEVEMEEVIHENCRWGNGDGG